jgi:hypothetical protein
MANHIWSVEVHYHIHRSLVICSISLGTGCNLQSSDRVGRRIRLLCPYSVYPQPLSLAGDILCHLCDFAAIHRRLAFRWYRHRPVNLETVKPLGPFIARWLLRIVCKLVCKYVPALLQSECWLSSRWNGTEVWEKRDSFRIVAELFSMFLYVLTFLGTFAKLRKAIVSFVMSVRPSGTTRLTLVNGFSWNLIVEDFFRILRMRNVSGKSYRESQGTHFMFGTFLPKIVPFVR